MKDYNILEKDIRVPDIVNEKADVAFRQIKQDRKIISTSLEKKKKTRRIMILAISAATLVIMGCVAGAALRHIWSWGMRGTLQATTEQQDLLVEQGMAVVISEQAEVEEEEMLEKESDVIVEDGKDNVNVDEKTEIVKNVTTATSNGITIRPEMIITDGTMAYVSVSVDGYDLKENGEPAFGDMKLKFTDKKESSLGLSGSGSFFNGIISDDTGEALYADGSPVEIDEETGRIIKSYKNMDGQLEYVIEMRSSDRNEKMAGKEIQIELEGIGSLIGGTFIDYQEGKWNISVTLPAVDASVTLMADDSQIASPYRLKCVKLSPVSGYLEFDVPEAVEKPYNSIPSLRGVVLADGSKWFIANGGSSGYTDDSWTALYDECGFSKVVDPKEVIELLVVYEPGIVSSIPLIPN